MAIYVKLKNNIVIKALDADADFIATYQDGEPGNWIEVSNNVTYSIGDTYIPSSNKFKPARPFSSWVWNVDNWAWESTIEQPTTENDDDEISWNDDTQQWIVTSRVTE